MTESAAPWRRVLAYWWYAWGLSWCYWGIRWANLVVCLGAELVLLGHPLGQPVLLSLGHPLV